MFAEAAEAALLVSSELIRSRIVAIRAVSFMARPHARVETGDAQVRLYSVTNPSDVTILPSASLRRFSLRQAAFSAAPLALQTHKAGRPLGRAYAVW